MTAPTFLCDGENGGGVGLQTDCKSFDLFGKCLDKKHFLLQKVGLFPH
jgi:hypothetical protein